MRHRRSKLPKPDQEVSKLHIEIHLLLEELVKKDQCPLKPVEMENFLSSSSYAEAVLRFRKEGIDPNKWWFSCENELLLRYAGELKEKYQVGICTPKEGIQRELDAQAQQIPVERNWCMGSPMMSKDYHQAGEITDKEWFSRKPIRKIQN